MPHPHILLTSSCSTHVHCSQWAGRPVQVSFTETRATLLDRPWAVDNLDAVLARFSQRQYEKAILFCDNAGSDVVLGAHRISCPALQSIFKQTIRKPSTSSAELYYRSGICHKFQISLVLPLPLPRSVSCLEAQKFSHLYPAISSKVWACWASERALIKCRGMFLACRYAAVCS